MPETVMTYVKTESLARLLNPIARQARPPGSARFNHYMTEYGVNPPEEGVHDVSRGEQLKAKMMLRASLFFLNKGMHGLWYFVDLGNDGYQLVPDAAARLASYPTNPTAYLSLPLNTLRNLSMQFKQGAAAITTPRQLNFETAAVSGAGGGQIFAGNASHPPLTYEDVLTLLPYQLSNDTFLIGAYVMSRNIATALPHTSFAIRISHVKGAGAQVTAVDPMDGSARPVAVAARGPNSLTVVMELADVPYLLRIQD
jgi:hypothetical protein